MKDLIAQESPPHPPHPSPSFVEGMCVAWAKEVGFFCFPELNGDQKLSGGFNSGKGVRSQLLHWVQCQACLEFHYLLRHFREFLLQALLKSLSPLSYFC